MLKNVLFIEEIDAGYFRVKSQWWDACLPSLIAWRVRFPSPGLWLPKCRECGKNFPNRVVIDGKEKNICNRKRCLECSPFGSTKAGCPLEKYKCKDKDYNASWSAVKSIHDRSTGECRVCGINKGLRAGRRCHSCNTKIRRHRMKLKAIEYLGGKCERCGYNEHIAGLEFHHKYGKDFGIGNCASKRWDIVKQELDKCELICAICHRVEHSNRDDEKFLKEVFGYKSKTI